MFKIEVIGNLGADATLQQTASSKFYSINVAHSESYTDKQTGELIKSTSWFSCSINWDASRLLPYLKKGTKVFVRGSGRTKIFTGHDGKQHAGINITVSEIELCGIKNEKNEDDNENIAPF